MEILLKKTKGFCPQCKRIVAADVFAKNNEVYIRKMCQKDGYFEAPYFWQKIRHYKTIEALYREKKRGQPIAQLVYINYKCNQSCNFCFVAVDEKIDFTPSIAEILNKIKNFKGQYIYLCGGEPTLRLDLFEIITKLKRKKFKVILMTNGKKLVDTNYVKKLEETGLDIVQLQFDTLDDRQYIILRKEELLDIKLKVIDNLAHTKILLQLWVMLVKGINDDQVEKIIRYAARNSNIISTVFLIPAWRSGRFPAHQQLTKPEILDIMQDKLNIGEDDFLTYTTFDFYISEIFNYFINKQLNRSSMCNLDCHLFVVKDSIIPLTKLIDLQKANIYLKIIYETLKKTFGVKKWKIFLKLAYFFLFRQPLLNIKLIAFIFRTMISFFDSFMKKQYPLNRHGSSFHVRVGSFVEIANSDMDCIKHCNICSNYANNLLSHCFSEILKNRN